MSQILELETKDFQDEFAPGPELPALEERTKNRPGKGSDVAPRLFDIEGKAVYISEPFLNTCTVNSSPTALPYHWYELGQLLLDAAPDDLVNPDTVSNLLRDLREVRQAKMRRGYKDITDGSEGVILNGVGAMEISESRAFITGVMAGLRSVGGSREQARRETAEEERENREREEGDDDDDDLEMS